MRRNVICVMIGLFVIVSVMVSIEIAKAAEVDKSAFLLPEFSSQDYNCGTAKQLIMQRYPGKTYSSNGALDITLNANEGAELTGDPALIAGKIADSLIAFNGKLKILPCNNASKAPQIIIEGNSLVFKLTGDKRLAYYGGSGTVIIDGKPTQLGGNQAPSLATSMPDGSSGTVAAVGKTDPVDAVESVLSYKRGVTTFDQFNKDLDAGICKQRAGGSMSLEGHSDSRTNKKYFAQLWSGIICKDLKPLKLWFKNKVLMDYKYE